MIYTMIESKPHEEKDYYLDCYLNILSFQLHLPLSSANITAHAVSFVASYPVTMVEIFRPSQNKDLRGVLAGPVSKVKV